MGDGSGARSEAIGDTLALQTEPPSRSRWSIPFLTRLLYPLSPDGSIKCPPDPLAPLTAPCSGLCALIPCPDCVLMGLTIAWRLLRIPYADKG